jgi:ribosomal protein S14
VSLELVQKDTDPEGVAKVLKITGNSTQINGTRMDIFTTLLPKEEKTAAKLAPGGQVKSEFPVPQGAVGVIIGKKGETITQLQGETVTRCNLYNVLLF